MNRASDFDGDGRDELPVTSPWGLGVLELSGSSLRTRVIASNGTRFPGGWLLNTDDNRFDRTADLDGDGRDEIAVASPWGVGVLERSGSRLRTAMLAPNGTRFDGWLLNTVNDALGPTGDLDGDGRAEILVTSPWGLGVWSLAGSTFDVPMMEPNGTRFDGWLLNTEDNQFRYVGDLDGDGRDEIVVTSPWGLGILALDGDTLDVVFMASNGTRLGEWLLNTEDNRIAGLCDLDGDGRSELLIASPWGLGVLELDGGDLTSRHMIRNGTRIGGWLVNSIDNRFAPAGDYDGDGRDEVLFASPWGIGVMEEAGGDLRMSMMAANGTRFGGWLLNTADNRFGPVGDYDGDGSDELVVSSPWGMAVLDIEGSSVSPRVMASNGTRFDGGWLLNTDDNSLGIGPEVVRLHLKILDEPNVDIEDMVTEMKQVYAQAGIYVHLVSTEELDLGAALQDVNIGACAGGVTAEQTNLFSNRGQAPATDVVIYFVRSTTPPVFGCASFPDGQPGAVVTSTASVWTMGHEVGHILDLGHVADTDRLMTGGGTPNITNPPPDLTPGEANTSKASFLTHPI